MAQFYHSPEPFVTENGDTIGGLTIAYDTYGTLSPARDNIIWVCHALTANSEVADWWEHTVERGKFLDPERYFIVCANFLCSHYGTTGPLSVNPATGEKWYGDFPRITVRDMVACHRRLAAHLGIRRVKMLVGSSIGGFQCMEWAIADPDFAEKLVLIATATRSMPWAQAFNESQRMCIELDPSFGERRDDAGESGMAVARSIALMSYRGAMVYDRTQDDAQTEEDAACFEHRVHSYQRYQGEKLRRRFNAYAYYRLSQAVDSHNVARGRGTLEEVLGSIKAQTLVVAITSDILFTPESHRPLYEYIPDAEFRIMDSDFGHDGFLVEHEQLDAIIQNFMKK